MTASAQPKHPVLRFALRSLWLGVILYLGLCGLLFFFQDQLIYLPKKGLDMSPERLRAERGHSAREGLGPDSFRWEEVALLAEDGTRLHAWWLEPGVPKAGCILVSHGNAGNISDRLELCWSLMGMGYAVLLFDYRGFGLSEGSPDEQGLYQDAEAAYQHLVRERQIAPAKIAILGRSLGGAVAIELAAAHPELGALLVESSFTSMGAMASHLYPWIPVRYLLRHRFDSMERIGAIACPKLVMHSPLDEYIPFAMGEELFRAAAEPKEFLRTSGGHNQRGFRSTPASTQAVADFLAAALD